MEVISQNAIETKKLGQMLARSILEMRAGKQALVLALTGELGGGKTTFIQGLAKGLGIKQHLTSPTFVIMKNYSICRDRSRPVPTRVDFYDFYHLDCYRLKNEKDLIILGIEEILAKPQNIVAIEWAGRVKGILPRDRLEISFRFISETAREIQFKVKS